MMKNKYFFMAFIWCLAARALPAQLTAPVVQLDKPFYVTGEVLRYQLFLPPSYNGQDVALKIALLEATGAPVHAYYQHTAGANRLDGYLKLPYDLESAVYHLLVLGTDKTSLQKVKLAEMLIPVYNDLKEEDLPVSDGTGLMEAGTAGEDLKVTIALASGAFQKREDIRAQVKVTDTKGAPVPATLSVSVIDAGLFASARNPGLQLPVSGQPVNPASLSRQLYLNGRISDTAGRPRASFRFGAYLHDLRASLIGTTDESGRFALPLPEMTGTANIQFVALQEDSIRVVLEDGIALASSPTLPYNEPIAEYLKWSRSRKVIYQLYNSLETKLEQELPERKLPPIEPDQRIILAEYPDFKKLSTFFIEVGTPLKFRPEKDGSYKAQMFNPDPRMRVFYQRKPVFIVDGKMTRNVDFLEQLALSKIDTIDLYFDFFKLNEYFDKIGSNSGIAVLRTSIPNMEIPPSDAVNIFPVNGLLPKATEVMPAGDTTHRPIFRSGLLWLPDLSAGNNGQASLHFTQSDDLGTFLIRVVAHTADGRIGTATKSYQVQW